MSLRDLFAKFPVPRLIRTHGKSGMGQYVISSSSNGKYHGLPFVTIENKMK